MRAVLSEPLPFPDKARDTVVTDIPKAFATSASLLVSMISPFCTSVCTAIGYVETRFFRFENYLSKILESLKTAFGQNRYELYTVAIDTMDYLEATASTML